MDLGPVLSQQARAIIASLVVSTAAVVLTTGLLGNWLLSNKAILPGPMLTVRREVEESGQ